MVQDAYAWLVRQEGWRSSNNLLSVLWEYGNLQTAVIVVITLVYCLFCLANM